MVNKKPIEYGELACEALMHQYLPEELPPAGALFYHQGVFLSGMQRIYLLNRNKKYFNYIKSYVDSVIGENGEIYGICHEVGGYDDSTWGMGLRLRALTMLDCKQPSILFYNLYDETGDEKYMTAAKTIAESMYYWPVNEYGGYWHMMTQPNQMWMDGAYMAGPFSVMYAEKFNDNILRDRAINQILIMDDHMKDEKTGLYYHGWDPTKQTEWADKKTGLSANFWGRGVGWYPVAILDILDYIPKDHPNAERLKSIVRDLLKSLVRFQDKTTGMWFEVLDKTDREDNWVESSCTTLFIYSYAKAMRMGIIGEEYNDVMMRAYQGIVDRLYFDDEGYIVIDNICIGTCIDSGTYEHYINRETVRNDLHGAGAFILMCAEMEEYLKWQKN